MTRVKHRYTVVLLSDLEEPGYTALVPKLPGCVSEGSTIEEALANIREAIEGHLEALAIGDGEEIPQEIPPAIIAAVEVEPDLAAAGRPTPAP